MIKGIQPTTGTVHYAHRETFRYLGASADHLVQNCGMNKFISAGGQRYSLEEIDRDVTCKRCIAAEAKRQADETAKAAAKAARPARPAAKKATGPSAKKETRYAALRELGGKYRDEAAILAVGRETVATEIEALAPLGRTPRWDAAIAEWAREVREHENLSFAWFQYSIFAGHAA